MSGIFGGEWDGIVDCVKAIAELVAATLTVERHTQELENNVLGPGKKDPGHIKALGQAIAALKTARDKVRRSCALYAGAAAAIAAAEAAIEAAAPYLLLAGLP